MASSSALLDKIARNPMRFGMIAGFLGIPVLWMAGESLIGIVEGRGVLPADLFWSYEASGALVGAILGAQGVKMWAAWRAGNVNGARQLALVTGVLGILFYAGLAVLGPRDHSNLLWGVLSRFQMLVLYHHHLPFLLFLLLTVVGLFGPRR